MPSTKSKGVLKKLSVSEQNQPKRRGPKPKTIKERVLRPEDLQVKPIVYPERSWNQRQKIRVLVFLFHYRIPTGIPGEFRAPTQKEAEDIYGVPQRTISDWVRKEKQIEGIGAASPIRTMRTEIVCRWPEVETNLYNTFLERREQGQAVRQGWFRVQAMLIPREKYPRAGEMFFRFSKGWFSAFLQRHQVSLRCITKTAQMIPEEYQRLLTSWMQFNRRNSQPRNKTESALVNAVGRYLLRNIFNVDETPIPFEYLTGRTYDLIGSKTIWVKETRSGWDKRQASLVLCVFADGINRVPPMIIFHSTGQRLGKEWEKYHPSIIVEFNDTAYMNDTLFTKYLQLYVIPVLKGRPSLFALDLCGSHKTEPVLQLLRTHDVIPSFIPAGCTCGGAVGMVR